MTSMTKLFNWMFAAVLICCGGGLTSCVNDDNPADSVPSTPDIPEGGVSLFEFDWDYDLPGGYYLAPGVYAELKETLTELIDEEPQMAINEDTYLVILDKVSDLPGDKLVELYHSGVTIGFANPKKAEIDALYQEYPDLGYYCNDDDIDRALLFAISSFNNGSYIIPDPEKFKEQFTYESDNTDPTEPTDPAAGKYDPDESLVYTIGDDHDLLYFYYGMFLADQMSELAKYEEETVQARALTRAGEAGDKDKLTAQIKRAEGKAHVGKPGVIKISEIYFRKSYRFNGEAVVNLGCDVYPIHVYEGENGAGDYYFMDMTASISNETMYKGKDGFTTGGFPVYLRWCGAYATKFRAASTLINAKDSNEVANVMFTAEGFPIPSTVVKDVDHSESKTFSIGCGISGGYDGKSGSESSGQPGQDPTAEKLTSGGQWGIKASVNPSWSWTDTKKWNVKDVDLENQTSGNTAAWSLIYNNLPEFNSSYEYWYKEGESRSFRSTTTIRGSWVWYIPNVPDDSEPTPRRIKLDASADYGFQRFFATYADNKEFRWHAKWNVVCNMPKIANYKAGNIILKNDTTKFISNIMIYNKDGKEMISKYRFQNSYPAGKEINLGAYKCADDLIVKFKMDGKTYVYKQNDYVKPIFKESVTLYVTNDFKKEE